MIIRDPDPKVYNQATVEGLYARSFWWFIIGFIMLFFVPFGGVALLFYSFILSRLAVHVEKNL